MIQHPRAQAHKVYFNLEGGGVSHLYSRLPLPLTVVGLLGYLPTVKPTLGPPPTHQTWQFPSRRQHPLHQLGGYIVMLTPVNLLAQR
jgi:hypothetical protein